MLYSVSDLSERFGVKTTTILHWIKTLQLRAINVGRELGLKKPRWRVNEQSLAEFEAARTLGQPASPKKKKRKKNPELVEFFK
jgi:hypothetical protein